METDSWNDGNVKRLAKAIWESHRHIDGNVTKFWATKKQAVEAAKSIGWPKSCVGEVWTRFQRGYAIRDNDGAWMTKERFHFISNIR